MWSRLRLPSCHTTRPDKPRQDPTSYSRVLARIKHYRHIKRTCIVSSLHTVNFQSALTVTARRMGSPVLGKDSAVCAPVCRLDCHTCDCALPAKQSGHAPRKKDLVLAHETTTHDTRYCLYDACTMLQMERREEGYPFSIFLGSHGASFVLAVSRLAPTWDY